MTIDSEAITLGSIFIAGLATSLHCAGMCGLLTCGLGIAGHGPAIASVGLYHFFRLVGYSVAGAIAGFIGGQLGFTFSINGVSWLPALLVIFLIAIIFGLDKKMGAVPGLSKVIAAIRRKTMSLPTPARASIIGLATPLLPCGPLYAILAIALASGSAIRGTEIMLAFGLGPVLAIAAVQLGSAWVNKKLGAKGFLYAKRGLAAAAAISLIWHFSLLPGGIAADGNGDGSTCRCDLEIE